MVGSISILNTRYKRFAEVIALKTGFLQQMWRITIVPLLAVSGDKPFLEMYFRFVAQSSRSQTVNSGAMDFRTRPEAVF
jgi:hypothetical protein